MQPLQGGNDLIADRVAGTGDGGPQRSLDFGGFDAVLGPKTTDGGTNDVGGDPSPSGVNRGHYRIAPQQDRDAVGCPDSDGDPDLTANETVAAAHRSDPLQGFAWLRGD